MMYQFGVSQYIGSSVRLHISTSGESFKMEPGGSGTEIQSKQNLMHLGGKGVIANLVELSGEIGGGKRTDQRTGVADDKYDVGQVNLGLAIYPGKSFSIGLSLEVDVDKQTEMPSDSEYTETSSKVRLFATYWFSEKSGLHLSVYSVVKESKYISGGFEIKMTETNNGMGLYAGFRF